MQDSAPMHVYLENFQTSTDFTEIELNVSHQSQKCLTIEKNEGSTAPDTRSTLKKASNIFFSSLAFPLTYYEGSWKSRYSFPPVSFPAFQQLMHRSKFSPSFFKASKRICGFVLTDISRLTRCSCFPWYRRRIETLVREKTRVFALCVFYFIVAHRWHKMGLFFSCKGTRKKLDDSQIFWGFSERSSLIIEREEETFRWCWKHWKSFGAKNCHQSFSLLQYGKQWMIAL